MMNLADHLNKTGNEWAVAITKSVFFPDERKQLIELWDLVGIKSSREADNYFGGCMAQIAKIFYPGERINKENIMFIEAKPGTLSTLDPVIVTLSLNKSVVSLLAIDKQMEKEVREIATVANRIARINTSLCNLKNDARLHKKFAEKRMGSASQFDDSECDHMLVNIQADMAGLRGYVEAITSRVRCF